MPAQGTPLHVASEDLGHASTTISKNLSGNLVEGHQRAAGSTSQVHFGPQPAAVAPNRAPTDRPAQAGCLASVRVDYYIFEASNGSARSSRHPAQHPDHYAHRNKTRSVTRLQPFVAWSQSDALPSASSRAYDSSRQTAGLKLESW